MKKLFSLTTLLVALTACEEMPRVESDETTPLVVEGWIAEGEAPVVMVTHAVDLTSDTADFSGFIEKWGRVSVFDGDRRYVLTGRINNGYLPSLIFTTSSLKGQPGHDYRLLVETEKGNGEATARLLPSATGLQVAAETIAESDSDYVIRATAEGLDPDATYKFYVRTLSKESHFYPAFKATFTGSEFPADGFIVSRMQRIAADKEAEESFSHYFHSGEVVQVRLCRIPSELLPFWRVYDNTVALGSNMLLSFADNCPGNVAGAYGYWQPAGATTRTLRIP